MSSDANWPKLSRDRLITRARRIMEADGTEDEIDSFADQFEAAVLMPNASSLLFWPENHPPSGVSPSEYDPTPEEVVDRVACGLARLSVRPLDRLR